MNTLFILVALGLIAAMALYKRAQLTQSIEKIQSYDADIDQKLITRYDSFEELITVMDQHMDTETTTFGAVKDLQKKALAAREAGDQRAWVSDEDLISRQVEGVAFAFEQHEALKLDDNANALFKRLLQQEGELAELKLVCNAEIKRYYELKHSLFGSMVVLIFGNTLNKDFEAWHVNADAINNADLYEVEL